MKNYLGQKITKLYVSLTEKCNLNCRYCMPEPGAACQTEEKVLSREEITRLVKIAAGLGIQELVITGGEPTLCEDLEELIIKWKQIDGIERITLLTNGVTLYERLAELKKAGLDEVWIHLDTTQTHQYKRITRGKVSSMVPLQAVWRAVSLDFPTRIVCVLQEELGDEVRVLAGIAKQYPVGIDFTELLPVCWGHDGNFLSKEKAFHCLKISHPDLKKEENEDPFYETYRSRDLKGSIRFTGMDPLEPDRFEPYLHMMSDGLLKMGIGDQQGCELGNRLRQGESDVQLKAAMRAWIAER